MNICLHYFPPQPSMMGGHTAASRLHCRRGRVLHANDPQMHLCSMNFSYLEIDAATVLQQYSCQRCLKMHLLQTSDFGRLNSTIRLIKKYTCAMEQAGLVQSNYLITFVILLDLFQFFTVKPIGPLDHRNQKRLCKVVDKFFFRSDCIVTKWLKSTAAVAFSWCTFRMGSGRLSGCEILAEIPLSNFKVCPFLKQYFLNQIELQSF